jgi:C4-dicarboxylate transporter, DctM subunit
VSPEVIGALFFLVSLVLLALGLHIGLALGFSGVLGIFLILGSFSAITGLLKTNPYHAVGIYDLSVVPLFILMGEFSYSGGISGMAYDALNKWISMVRGGLAIVTTWGCVIFGALSGSSVATASVFTKMSYPEMKKAGYEKYFATGVIAAARAKEPPFTFHFDVETGGAPQNQGFPNPRLDQSVVSTAYCNRSC